MNLTAQIARLLTNVYFGGNWTAVNFQETLSNVTWQEATTKNFSLNTIAALVYHTNYYVKVLTNVLTGDPLSGHDKLSFECPSISSQQDWEKLLDEFWACSKSLAALIEQFPEQKLWNIFSEEKYGNYYRNIHGVIKHCHYHLGQIVLIKKMLAQTSA